MSLQQVGALSGFGAGSSFLSSPGGAVGGLGITGSSLFIFPFSKWWGIRHVM